MAPLIDHRSHDVASPVLATAPGISRAEFIHRALTIAGLTVLVLGLGSAFIVASDVFFLFFLAILLAILLRSVSDGFARWTGIGPGWSLALVVLGVVGLAAAGTYAVGEMVAAQMDRLVDDLPRSLDRAQNYLQRHEWGRQILSLAPSAADIVSGEHVNAASRVASFFSTTLGVLGNLVVLIFVTLYLAVDPGMYQEGLLRLLAPHRRARGREVMHVLGDRLRWWLIGRSVAMIAVAIIVAGGLWLAGVPQFLVLGLVAGLLTAIPYLGPILGALPGILLALMQGPTTALWAVTVYLLAQAAENYLITPLVQQNTVELPPVLTIMAIALIGVLFGVLGLIVASPIAVTILVLVRMLYVEDVLGDRPEGAEGKRH